jgi:hypothetical protein
MGLQRLWRLFGLRPRSRRGSRSVAALERLVTIDLSPAIFFWGCCAAAPEKPSTSKLFFDPFGNIQGRRDTERSSRVGNVEKLCVSSECSVADSSSIKNPSLALRQATFGLGSGRRQSSRRGLVTKHFNRRGRRDTERSSRVGNVEKFSVTSVCLWQILRQ